MATKWKTEYARDEMVASDDESIRKHAFSDFFFFRSLCFANRQKKAICNQKKKICKEKNAEPTVIERRKIR